jgi:hypothetical protein
MLEQAATPADSDEPSSDPSPCADHRDLAIHLRLLPGLGPGQQTFIVRARLFNEVKQLVEHLRVGANSIRESTNHFEVCHGLAVARPVTTCMESLVCLAVLPSLGVGS